MSTILSSGGSNKTSKKKKISKKNIYTKSGTVSKNTGRLHAYIRY